MAECAKRYAEELDAAAAILQRVHPIGRVKSIGRLKVAAALAELFPADDAELVTPTRLMAAGARRCSGCQYTVGTGPWTLTFFDDGPGELYIKAAFFCKAPTWGQFRKLADALGIELREAP